MNKIPVLLLIWTVISIIPAWSDDSSRKFIFVGMKGEVAFVDLTSNTVNMKAKAWSHNDVISSSVSVPIDDNHMAVGILTRDSSTFRYYEVLYNKNNSEKNTDALKDVLFQEIKSINGLVYNTGDKNILLFTSDNKRIDSNIINNYSVLTTKTLSFPCFVTPFSYGKRMNRFISSDKYTIPSYSMISRGRDDLSEKMYPVGRSEQITTYRISSKTFSSNEHVVWCYNNLNGKYKIYETKESVVPYTYSKTSVLMHYLYYLDKDGAGRIRMTGNYTVYRNADMSLHHFSVPPEYRVIYCDETKIFFGFNPSNESYPFERSRKPVLYSYPYASEGEKEIKVEMQLPFGPFMMFPIESQSAEFTSFPTPSPTPTPIPSPTPRTTPTPEPQTTPLAATPTATPSPVTPTPESGPQAIPKPSLQATTSNNNKILYATIAALILLAGAGIILLRRKRN